LEKSRIPRDVVDINGVKWLMSGDMLGAFDEVYLTPQMCGYGTQSWFRNMDMKDSVNACNTLIDG
jgi:hypothetical protein